MVDFLVLFDNDGNGDGRSAEDSVTDLGDRLFDAETVLEQLDARLDDLSDRYDRSQLETVCPYCFNYIPNTDDQVLNFCVSCKTDIGFAFLVSLSDSSVVRIVETI